MHRIVAVRGVVLAKRGAGEANTLAAILTNDLGLIRASARSARVEKSKLRYGLEPLVEGRFSLVQGRYEWKLTGASDVSQALLMAPTFAKQRVGKVARLLLRLIHGEEAVPDLYATVVSGFRALSCARDTAHADNIECVLVVRILAHLGYLPQEPRLAAFVSEQPADGFFSTELMAQAAGSRPFLIRTINESLSATGL